jgi:hypothetical protein
LRAALSSQETSRKADRLSCGNRNTKGTLRFTSR